MHTQVHHQHRRISSTQYNTACSTKQLFSALFFWSHYKTFIVYFSSVHLYLSIIFIPFCAFLLCFSFPGNISFAILFNIPWVVSLTKLLLVHFVQYAIAAETGSWISYQQWMIHIIHVVSYTSKKMFQKHYFVVYYVI